MDHDMKPFRLLDLPPELREQILLFALAQPQPIEPRVIVPRDAFVHRLPALTRASRLLRQESLPLYFEANIFHFKVRDVLEPTLSQDLRFDKKLLTFGAWCEAAGREMFGRIRKFEFETLGGADAVNVCVTLGKGGRVDVEVRSYWLRGKAKPASKAAPESLVGIVKEAARSNEKGCLYPEDVVTVCREIRRCGADLLVSK